MHILQAIIENNEGQPAPNSTSHGIPHTQYLIEIDKDHTATLTIGNDSLEVLKNLEDEPICELPPEKQKELFKNTFSNEEFDFGTALDAMKKGFKVAYPEWVEKGMFAYYVPPASYPASRNNNGTMLGIFPNDLVPYNGYFALKLADNTVSIFNPCASEMIRKDWVIVE